MELQVCNSTTRQTGKYRVLIVHREWTDLQLQNGSKALRLTPRQQYQHSIGPLPGWLKILFPSCLYADNWQYHVPVKTLKNSNLVASESDFKLFRRLVPLVNDGKTTHLNPSFMPPSNLIVIEAIGRFCSGSPHRPSPKPCWREDVEIFCKYWAKYINSDPSSVAFVRNTTERLGRFIHGLKFEAGDNVVILDCEHLSQAFGWMALRASGLEVRLVRTDPEKPAAANANTVAPHVDARTKAIGLSSIMFHGGQWNDAAGVCKAYRHRGIHVLADLTQQVGFADVDVQASGVSAAAFSLHKGLNTPTDFAALYVDATVMAEMDPTPARVGHGGISSAADCEDLMISDGPIVFRPTMRRYEHANMDFILAIAARAFLDFIPEAMGPKNVEDHILNLGGARPWAGLVLVWASASLVIWRGGSMHRIFMFSDCMIPGSWST